MRLVDQIAQCRTPFIVQSLIDHRFTRLNGAADCAGDVVQCPIRYVLSDDLTRLCTALAYSKGARHLACADLLRVPARRVWIEWCNAAWLTELSVYGFKADETPGAASGRRGALVQASPEGRSGTIRTFWNCGESGLDVLASSMEAYFDLDTEDGEVPEVPDNQGGRALCVVDGANQDADILRRCFRFRFERSWADYYERAMLSCDREQALAHHALGTIAPHIPMLLAFFLLLSTRTGLPRRTQALERINRSRARTGKAALLDHIEALSPLSRDCFSPGGNGFTSVRRAPRLHHVRGHLVRHGSQLFWRVPHLRGNARSGIVHTRTVTWTIDRPTHRSNGPMRAAVDQVAPP